MKHRALVACAVAAALSFSVAACGDDEPESSGSGNQGSGAQEAPSDAKVGVILPDTASSKRWENNDRPLLQAAFEAAGVESDIQNAQGDKAKFATIADQMLSGGATVLLIVNLDSPSAAAVIQKATQQGVPVIDYDRLTLGGNASYYVSFDNVAVGTKIGEGLVKCMQDNGKDSGPVALLNGSPTDNNATLFKEGYEKAITDAGYTVTED
jgi:D-xylose transport system substrate-binding protein